MRRYVQQMEWAMVELAAEEVYERTLLVSFALLVVVILLAQGQ